MTYGRNCDQAIYPAQGQSAAKCWAVIRSRCLIPESKYSSLSIPMHQQWSNLLLNFFPTFAAIKNEEDVHLLILI